MADSGKGKTALEKRLAELDALRERGVITPEEYDARRAAIIADASTPAPAEKKRGGIMKWGLLGCLGIFAVIGLLFVGLIVLIAAALSGAGDDEEDLGGDVHVPLAQGSVGEIAPENNGSKRAKVTILEIVDGAQSSNEFLKPDPGMKYYALRVEVENVGTREVNSLDWKLRDSNDGEHDRAFVTGLTPSLEVVYNLTPGGKVNGWVVFEIPENTTPKWIRADPNLFLAHDLYFDAQ